MQSIIREGVVEAGQISCYCGEVRSAKPRMVLLHGIGSRWNSWLPVVDQLAEHFSLYIPDLRGHGQSGRPVKGYTLPDYARDLQELLKVRRIHRPFIVGHSLGAMIAAEWAAAHPGVARALVLEDPPLRGAENAVQKLDAWLQLLALPESEISAHYRLENPAWSEDDCQRRANTFKKTKPAVFEELRDVAVAQKWPDVLPGLQSAATEVLMIHGDLANGAVVSTADRDEFVATVERGTAFRISGGSHSLHRNFTTDFLGAAIPYMLQRA